MGAIKTTDFYKAVCRNNVGRVEKLLDDTNTSEEMVCAGLNEAVRGNSCPMVKLLLPRITDTEALRSGLEEAVRHGNSYDMVKLLQNELNSVERCQNAGILDQWKQWDLYKDFMILISKHQNLYNRTIMGDY